MVSLPVLQHQMLKFRIKHVKFHKETTHIPSIHLSLSVPIESFHWNSRITKRNSFHVANSDPDSTNMKSPFTGIRRDDGRRRVAVDASLDCFFPADTTAFLVIDGILSYILDRLD